MSSKSKTSRAKSTAVLSTMVLLGTFAAFTPKTLARYSGGTGEPNDPYRIATPQDLNDIGNYEENWDNHFVLVNDVNLSEYTGTQFNIIGNWIIKFTGVFDGNDHKVWNFTWSTDRNGIGLFGYVSNSGQIKNLGMENMDVNAVGGWYVGGLAGENRGHITNCYSTGDVSGIWYYVGGLVGVNFGTVSNSYCTGSVNGDRDVGGLVGYNSGTIINCYSTARVSGSEYTGGLVGGNSSGGTITNCYSTGSASGGQFVGGLVGVNHRGTITNCYSTGSATGTRYIGGLVGQNGIRLIGYYPGYIFNSYSTCSVQGTLGVGGLVGYNEIGELEKSFWDVQTSGEPNMCGIQGDDATGCDPNCGKTTAEMQTAGTFLDAGWDFVEIWGIGENQTYPYLRFAPAGDLDYDKKVDLFDLAILASHWLEEN